MASLNISMTEELKSVVERRLSDGGFSTPSEYIRHLIREDQKREAERRLEVLLLEGLDSGAPRALEERDWENLQRVVRERFLKRRGE